MTAAGEAEKRAHEASTHASGLEKDAAAKAAAAKAAADKEAATAAAAAMAHATRSHSSDAPSSSPAAAAPSTLSAEATTTQLAASQAAVAATDAARALEDAQARVAAAGRILVEAQNAVDLTPTGPPPARALVTAVDMRARTAWAETLGLTTRSSFISTTFLALGSRQEDGTIRHGVLPYLAGMAADGRGDDVDADTDMFGDLEEALRSLSDSPTGARPLRVFAAAASSLDNELMVADEWRQPSLSSSAALRELAFLTGRHSSSLDVRTKTALGRVLWAASQAKLSSLCMFLMDVVPPGEAVRLLMSVGTAATAEVSLTSLRALDARLSPLGTLLALPADARVPAVARRLEQERDDASAADRDRGAMVNSRADGGTDSRVGASQSMGSAKLAKLQRQFDTPASQRAYAGLSETSALEDHILAVASSGSVLAQMVVRNPATASQSGVPGPIAKVAGMLAVPAAGLRFLSFCLAHGSTLSYRVEEGEQLVPPQAEADRFIFDTFPADVLTDQLVKTLMSRKLGSLTSKNFANLLQGGLAVRMGIDLEAAPSMGACPGCMWLLNTGLRPFMEMLGYDANGLENFLSAMNTTSLELEARGTPAVEEVNTAISFLLGDAEVRYELAVADAGGAELRPKAFIDDSATGAYMATLRNGFRVATSNARAERSNRTRGRLRLLPPATRGGGGNPPTPPARQQAPVVTPAAPAGGGGGGQPPAPGAARQPKLGQPPYSNGSASDRVKISGGRVSLAHGSASSTVEMFFLRGALEKQLTLLGFDADKLNLSWLVANQESTERAASYLNVGPDFGGPNRPMVLPHPDWFKKKYAQAAVDPNNPKANIAKFFV